MFGLQGRGKLKGVIQQEFENLMSRVRKFLLADHLEDGSHGPIMVGSDGTHHNGELGVTYEGTVTNIRIVNGIVVEVS